MQNAQGFFLLLRCQFLIAISIVLNYWVLCLVAGVNPASFAMQKLTSEHNTHTMTATEASELLHGLISSKYKPAIDDDYEIAYTTEEILQLVASSFPKNIIDHDLVYHVMINLNYKLSIPPTELSFKWLLKSNDISVL